MKSFAITALLAISVSAAPANYTPKCYEVAFPLSATATNYVIDPNLINFNDTAALSALLSSKNFTTQIVSGSDTIAGWYCEPAVTNSNNQKLQFFQTSITTNRDSFTALGGTDLGVGGSIYPPYQPENYDWLLYAANKGYATLSLDHLGNGKSSRPDPVLVAQLPYELELLHVLVGQIKAGTTGQLPCSYTDLIFVGNSYGSVIGNNFAAVYPDDFSQMVLTGFSASILPSLPGIALLIPLPAVLIDPVRFAGYQLGYVTALDKHARTNSFFGSPAQSAFDPEVANLFEQRVDVVSLGQFITTYILIVPAPAYKGRVLTLTGEHDQAFCGPGSPVLGEAHCGELLKTTGGLFPSADYNWYSVPESGHALILHLSHAETLDVAHRFLAGEKFARTAPPGS